MEIKLVETGPLTGTNGITGPIEQGRISTSMGERVLRVWHVDDSRNFRELLAAFLELQPGIKCERSLPSAEAALDALASDNPPDVILLDIRMEGMSGLDAIAPIKRLAPQSAVLMLTTLYGPDARTRAIESGASDVLLKTFRVEEIVERARMAHEALVHARTKEPKQSDGSLLPKAATKKTGASRRAQDTHICSSGSRRTLDELFGSRPARRLNDSTPLRRLAGLIRQAWLARRRRRQSPIVSGSI